RVGDRARRAIIERDAVEAEAAVRITAGLRDSGADGIERGVSPRGAQGEAVVLRGAEGVGAARVAELAAERDAAAVGARRRLGGVAAAGGRQRAQRRLADALGGAVAVGHAGEAQ